MCVRYKILVKLDIVYFANKKFGEIALDNLLSVIIAKSEDIPVRLWLDTQALSRELKTDTLVST